MSHNLLDQCLAAAKANNRTYPDGYGFALAYLKADEPDFNPAHLRDCARRIVAEAFARNTGHWRHVRTNDDDLIRYVVAQADLGWEHWLIEAAQLVHAAALAGDKEAARLMAYCGHPGFSV